MRPRRFGYPDGAGVSEIPSFSVSTITSRRSSAPANRAREAASPIVPVSSAPSAKDYPGSYDLVAFFDCLHDMGDPVGGRIAREGDAEPGRNLDAGRAVRQRSPRGKSQSNRPAVLRRIDDDLRARVTVTGSGPRPRHSGREKRACARCSPREDFRVCAARPRRRSTWCWKRGRSGRALGLSRRTNPPLSISLTGTSLRLFRRRSLRLPESAS